MPTLFGVGFLLFRFLGLRQTPCQSEIQKVPRFFCVRIHVYLHFSHLKTNCLFTSPDGEKLKQITMKKIYIFCFMLCISIAANAQMCKVQGIVQYYHNEYIGHKADMGAEVMFIKYSSALKIPNRQKWETYQDIVEKSIKAAYYRKYYGETDAFKMAGLTKEDLSKMQELGLLLTVEKDQAIEKGLVKYTTIVNGSGMYEISVPYGIYYILIKSKNRKYPSVLELNNRYHMVRVDLKSPTQIISFDFDVPLTDIF